MARKAKDSKQTNTKGAQNRLESGIPRLDYILKGGLRPSGTYAIYGPPGSGKTILANQFCFNRVKKGSRNCVYLTLLTESHTKMIEHIQELEFFDPAVVGSRIEYVSGYLSLKKGGPVALLEVIRSAMKKGKPDLFVIDGMESAEQFANKGEFKEFLHQLQALAHMFGCTLLLMSTCSGEEPRRTENTLVDGVIELSDRLQGPRAVRELTVHKFRGSDYLRGRHELEITSHGIQIHPRTEIQFDKPAEKAHENRERLKFGIKKFDEMLGGGIPTGSAVALLGAPGAGKTTLGLKFLIEGAKKGHRGLYFGFYEPPPRLMEKAESMGLDLKKFVKSGMIELVWQPPLEHFMDSLAEQLLEKIRDNPHTRRRLFIDGVEGFRAATIYDDRVPRFLSALTNQLRTYDVTTLFSEELPLFKSDVDMPNPELANVVESVILMRYVELKAQLYRLISILKMRESAYDTAIREFKISSNGIDVSDSFGSAEAILSGHAHVRENGGGRQ